MAVLNKIQHFPQPRTLMDRFICNQYMRLWRRGITVHCTTQQRQHKPRRGIVIWHK